MTKAVVFIDGNNFYFRLKDVVSAQAARVSLLDFQYQKFAQNLVAPNELVEIRYYIGALKRQKGNEKSEQMYADQQKLLAKLQNQKVRIVLGQLIQHPDKTFHEKGVDVRLAVELIRGAREATFDTAYLVSSDTDLVAAVEEVQSFQKKICYVGFPKAQSFGLSKTSNDVRIVRPEEVLACLPSVSLL